MNNESTICDRCDNYSPSPGGCLEKCDALYSVSIIRYNAEKEYCEKRFNGMEKRCKYYKKLRKAFNEKEII